MTRLTNDELADSLEQILPGCAPADWLAYEVPELQTKEACTVGHFGDWIVGSESNYPGGNFRDDDTGDDEHHAKFIALVKNHAPQIIAALRECPKSWHSETGWVIVTEGAGRLVYFSGSLLIPDPDPLRAVRFARQEDAERIRAALVAGELVASHMDAEERARRSVVTNWLNSRVEEHEWCGPSEQSKPNCSSENSNG